MNKSVCKKSTFDSLCHEHAKPLRTLMYFKCDDLFLAEYLAQESFIKSWDKCNTVVYEKAHQLPDASTVELDAMLSLSYTKADWEKSRNIEISGRV